MSLRAVYERSMKLQPVLKAMTQRGLRVNNALREERVLALSFEAARLQSEAQAALSPEVWDRLERPDLFHHDTVCPSCHNGKNKKLSCAQCGGQGKFYTVTLNLGSEQQLKDLLYNGLGLPERTQDGKVTTDEEALQSIVALDQSGIVKLALRYGKLDTQRSIYERIAPGGDGNVRTVFNAAGTYTGRLAAAGAFYVSASTNLHNLSASEAARDPLFAVRDCIIPDEDEVFIYADLSQAEARVSACLSEDHELLQRWRDPKWDIHRWTASAIFSKAESAVTPEERYLGKRCRHALNYGMGPNKFWRVINADADVTGIAITLTQAKNIHAAYHALHPKLDNVWWNRVERQLTEHGYLETVFGRRCNFYPRIDFDSGQLDLETLRAAIAFEPQSTVADLKTVALLDAYAAEGGVFRCLHEAHDAILVGAKKHAVRSTALVLRQALERTIFVNGIELKIPAEVLVGEESWSKMTRLL